MKCVSLFAGIGGFDLVLTRLGHKIVWANEWDKYASQIYKKHFKECDTRDITTISADSIPDHDFLCAGFPCQSFSVAGKRLGFADTRGTLFFDIARILKAKKPRFCLLENVKGLLSHDNGRTFKTIITTLDELGYDLQWQVLNSKNFGVPQNRERVFIIGHLRGTTRPEVFPIGEVNQKINGKSRQQTKISGAITARYHKMGNADTYIANTANSLKKIGSVGKDAQGNRIYSSDGISATLQGLAGGKGAKTGLYVVPVLTPDRINKRQNGRRFKYIPEGTKIRRLTPTECERLQGFPDNWTEGMSDTQRYKMLGNAVTVNVVEAILENWLI